MNEKLTEPICSSIGKNALSSCVVIVAECSKKTLDTTALENMMNDSYYDPVKNFSENSSDSMRFEVVSFCMLILNRKFNHYEDQVVNDIARLTNHHSVWSVVHQ